MAMSADPAGEDPPRLPGREPSAGLARELARRMEEQTDALFYSLAASAASAEPPPLTIAAINAAVRRILDAAPVTELRFSWHLPEGEAVALPAEIFELPPSPFATKRRPRRDLVVMHPRTGLEANGVPRAIVDAIPPGWELAEVPGLSPRLEVTWRRPLEPRERRHAEGLLRVLVAGGALAIGLAFVFDGPERGEA